MSVDLARSGDLARSLAHRSLRWATELLELEMSEPTPERFSTAVGLLADRLGWSLYDSGASADAGRMPTFALDHAARGVDRDLRAQVMLDLSTVLTDTGHPRDGVDVIRAALGDERVSPAERANLHAVCARHCAAAGERNAGIRHIQLAGVNGPGWARRITYGPGHHDSALGLALFAHDDVADATGVTSERLRRDLRLLQTHAAEHGAADLAAALSARFSSP